MYTQNCDAQLKGVKAGIPGRNRFLKDFKRSKFLLLLALPTLIYMIIFKYTPMYGLVISFFDYNAYLGISHSKFVGFDQFKTFFNNPDFLNILINTFLLGFLRLICIFPAPIVLALVINEVRNIHLKKFVQTISYLPHFVSVAVVASMTIMLLNPTSGLVNNLIVLLGGEPVYFMSKPEFFRPIYILTDIWQGTGWGSIIYLAAIAAIDPQLYESSVLDGANKLRQIAHITLPGIAQTVVVMFILNTGSIVSINFDKAFLLQNPLILSAADVLSTYVYRTGIQYTNYSYASGQSFISMYYVDDLQTQNTLFKSKNEKAHIRFFPPPKGGKNGQQKLESMSFENSLMVISSKSKLINEALKFGDWYYTDEAELLVSWGKEG